MSIDDLQRLAKAQVINIHQRLAEARSQEFPTNSPELFGEFLERLVDALGEFIQQNSDLTLLRYSCEILRIIGSHVRYLENASSSKVPAQLIGSIENLIQQTRPGARVLLRVQWSFNYTVIDISDIYRTILRNLLAASTIDTIFSDIADFCVVGIPTIEYSNVLLHAALGHEAGHRLATDYLKTEDQKNLVATTKAAMGDLGWYPGASQLPPLFRFNLSQRLLNGILRTRERALEELISDLVGWKTFGISALFTLHNISLVSVLDAPPAEETRLYPPWRLRLRGMMLKLYTEEIIEDLNSLRGSSPIDMIRDAAVRYVRELNDVVTDTSDWNVLNADGVLSRAYADLGEALVGSEAFISEKLGMTIYGRETFRTQIADLLERLALGFPPDELRDSTIPDFRSAMAAGWLYKNARVSVPYSPTSEWEIRHDETINRLVLKAIESIELTKSFEAWRSGNM
jgi:hypothetical protein